MRPNATLIGGIFIFVFHSQLFSADPGGVTPQQSDTTSGQNKPKPCCFSDSASTSGFEVVKPGTHYLSENQLWEYYVRDDINKSAGPGASSIVPFEYERKLIRLKVGMSDTGKKYDFYLDSGAPTFITNKVVSDNNLFGIDSTTAYDANRNSQVVNLYSLKEIKIGDRSFTKVPAAGNRFTDQMPILRGHADGGLIGADVMRKSVWLIDYKSNLISISDDIENFCLPKSSYRTKLKTDENGRPVIRVNLSDNSNVDFIVDLGFNGSVLVDDKMFSKDLYLDSANTTGEHFETGFKESTRSITYKYLRSMSFGNFYSGKVKTTSGGDNSQFLIGNEFLEQFTIIFDFRNRELILIPAGAKCEA